MLRHVYQLSTVTFESHPMSNQYGSIIRNVSDGRECFGAVTPKGKFPYWLCSPSRIGFGVGKNVIYLLKEVLVRLSCVQTSQVFAMLIAVTLVEPW
jgi:hypothetical protein